MDTKKCKKCGKDKPLSEFYMYGSSLRSPCKECKKDTYRKYRENNREKVAEQKKRHAQAHREHIARYQKKWRAENQEYRAEYSRNYKRNHPQKRPAGKTKLYMRAFHLKNKYGLSEQSYDELLRQQGGKCAICGTDDPHGRRHNRFHVDHCHKSGLIRGLLCSRCNLGLGSFLDDVNLLGKAIAYLSRANQENVG